MTVNSATTGANGGAKAAVKAAAADASGRKPRGKAPVNVSYKAADGTWDGNPGSNVTAVKVADSASKRTKEVELASIPAETRNKIVGLWIKGASKLQYRGEDPFTTVQNFLNELQKGVLKVGKKGKKAKEVKFPIDIFIDAMKLTAQRRLEQAKKTGAKLPVYPANIYENMREKLTIGTVKDRHMIMKAYERDPVFMQAFAELKLEAAAKSGESVDALAAMAQ